MKTVRAGFSLYLLLALWMVPTVLGQPARPQTATRHTLWKVEGTNAALYLLGSVHVLKAEDYPLPAPMEAAFTNSSIMQPLPSVTSCWRGYVCTYAAPNSKLHLHTLQVNLAQEGPEIHNIRPVFARDTFDNVYQDIHLPIHFTGSIRIATGFIQELYVHMGFAPAWKFETVFELSIAQGDVLDTQDISGSMAALRERMSRQPPHRGPGASQQEVEDWIASTFKRNYKE